MQCEAFFLYLRIIENILLRCQFSCSANAARTDPVESLFISKYQTNRFLPKHSFQSDNTTRKRMRDRHKEIFYHETSMKSCQRALKERY